MNKQLIVALSIILCMAVGGASSALTNVDLLQYLPTLRQPSWQPPNWVFGPVWTLLYLLMGIALGNVINTAAPTGYKKSAILVFAVQLLLNFFWSIIFFKWQSPMWALIEIIFLLVGILWTIFKFDGISKTAAWLMVPYAAWVSFATLLTATLFWMNR